MTGISKNIVRFIFILLLQVLILNKISLRWWTNPYGNPMFIPMVYPLFLLLLPFNTKVVPLLIIGFFTGLVVDVFYNTAGMHAAACVLMVYLRTNVLEALMQKPLEDYPNLTPGARTMGWVPFLVYSGFLIVVHNAVFFAIELWNLQNVLYLLLKIVASSITSMLFFIIYLLLFTRRPARSA